MYEDWIKRLTSIYILCLYAFQFECLLELWDTYLHVVPVSMTNFLSVKLIVHFEHWYKVIYSVWLLYTLKSKFIVHKVVYPIVL